MSNQFLVISGVFLIINLIAFFVMMLDKIKSERSGAPRISEGKIFFLASAFGSIGVYVGMFAFRHKTHKWHFLIGIPLLIIENAATLCLIYFWLIDKTL